MAQPPSKTGEGEGDINVATTSPQYTRLAPVALTFRHPKCTHTLLPNIRFATTAAEGTPTLPPSPRTRSHSPTPTTRNSFPGSAAPLSRPAPPAFRPMMTTTTTTTGTMPVTMKTAAVAGLVMGLRFPWKRLWQRRLGCLGARWKRVGARTRITRGS